MGGKDYKRAHGSFVRQGLIILVVVMISWEYIDVKIHQIIYFKYMKTTVGQLHLIKFWKENIGRNFLAVQWLGLGTFTAIAGIWSLVRNLQAM